MQFTFKRDEEGHERIYAGDVCVWQCRGDMRFKAGAGVHQVPGTATHREEFKVVCDAIERADEAGFWDQEPSKEARKHGIMFKYDEVTVDVPDAETSTTLVVVREGEE